MSNKISGKEYPLNKIFSSDFDYSIPAYQRPYAWTEEEASVLFDDLYDFNQTEKEDNYFLGSIVLIKDDDDPKADVIDGQQRLTTLTILLACIAFKSSSEYKNSFKTRINEPGDIATGVPTKPRLKLRSKDQDFFQKYIQSLELDELVNLNPSFTTESQEHIYKNCKVFLDKIDKCFENVEDIQSFGTFLLTKCFIVVVSTPSQQSAFRVFSVMNSRGMDLLPIDIIKSEVIGKISKDKQEKYTNKWENLEIRTTRAGFNEVFTHTRMIFTKFKAKKSLLEEFKEYVVSTASPEDLIDNILEPYCEMYITIKEKAYSSTEDASEINNTLMWLNKIDNNDWLPTAIKFFSIYNNDSKYILWFVKKLERLAAYLLITSTDLNHRIERYKWILDEMDRNPITSLDNPLKSIELTNEEKINFIKLLNGEIYKMTARKRNYIILRLDSFVSDGAATYDSSVLTIEHVLPQTVAPNSEWAKIWNNSENREYWLNRIANLVPLTRQHNSAAQNYDFSEKKEKYFKGKNGTTSYALTTQVINTNEWNKAIVELRQKDLLDVFKKQWELDETQEESLVPMFHLSLRGASAEAYRNEEGKFVVTKGSKIASDETSSLQSIYHDIRLNLKKSKVVINDIFTNDYEFDTVSMASCVVSGRSSNGRTEWSTIDGKTYSDIYGK